MSLGSLFNLRRGYSRFFGCSVMTKKRHISKTPLLLKQNNKKGSKPLKLSHGECGAFFYIHHIDEVFKRDVGFREVCKPHQAVNNSLPSSKLKPSPHFDILHFSFFCGVQQHCTLTFSGPKERTFLHSTSWNPNMALT